MPRLTKHEKFVVPLIADFLLDMWTVVRDQISTDLDRRRLDEKLTAISRCLAPDNPNMRPAKQAQAPKP